MTQLPTATVELFADSVLVYVVEDEVETSTLAAFELDPTLDVPPEPTIRPIPLMVSTEAETVATLPDAVASEKLPPPNPPPPAPPPPNPPPPAPPPPNPPPPPPRPPKPAAVGGHRAPLALMAMVRATIGPAAEPLLGGVPVAEIQTPAVRSWAVAATVWVNVVADVHATEVVPENWLVTLIEVPDREATEPDATGRALGDVVEDPDDPGEAALVEPAVLPHAALSMPKATTTRTDRRGSRHDRRRSDNEDRTVIAPPASWSSSTVLASTDHGRSSSHQAPALYD